MKKIIKIFTALLFSTSFLLSSFITVLAWTAPTIKDKYVEEEEEFRSVWVCTVSNMDIKKQMGTTPSAIQEWKNQYLTILENSIRLGFNAIIFQVRPCNDAFYPSKYNPWSAYLVDFGVDPLWDPLAWMIEVTHEAGLEYHAWLNPYRASTDSLSVSLTEKDGTTGISYIYSFDQDVINNYKASYFGSLKQIATANNTLVDNPIFKEGTHLSHGVVLGTEGKFILNPAATETVEHLNNTIDELITNYELDGIHFDDYFYPSNASYRGNLPEYKGMQFSSEPETDLLDYDKYAKAGGELNIYNWRRENVNQLIHSLSDLIRSRNLVHNRKCAFGISPSAHWAPSIESCPVGSDRGAEGGEIGNCNGYYSYSDLYADTRKWVLEEWIDYILPQNYTYLGSSQAGYPTGTYDAITKWWSNTVSGTNVLLYIGTGAYQISKWNTAKLCDVTELFYEMKWNQYKKYNVSGYVMFRYESLLSSTSATAMNQVRKYLWKKAALTPTYPSYEYESLKDNAKITNIFKHSDETYSVTFTKVDNAKAYGILQNGEVIARTLCQEELFFDVLDDKTYELVTYGQDNKTVETKEIIDLSKAYVNKAPVLSFTTPLEKEYLKSTKIPLKFIIEDAEDDEVTYSLYALIGTKEYPLLVNKTLVSGEINYEYECFAVEEQNICFKLIYQDASSIETYVSSSFDIVSKLKEEETIPPKEETDTPKEEILPPAGQPVKTNKKCGKKNTILITMLTAISACVYLIRKRK